MHIISRPQRKERNILRNVMYYEVVFEKVVLYMKLYMTQDRKNRGLNSYEIFYNRT